MLGLQYIRTCIQKIVSQSVTQAYEYDSLNHMEIPKHRCAKRSTILDDEDAEVEAAA